MSALIQTPSAGGALLYTSQTLTSAEAGQVQTNLNGTTGLPGYFKFGGDQVSGLQFLNAGNNVVAQLTNDLDHGGAGSHELKLTYGKTLYIAPDDPTTASFAVQRGPAGGGAGGGYWYMPPDSLPANNGEFSPSQYDLWTAAYKAAGTVTYTAMKLQASTDASGNTVGAFSAHSSGGYTTASLQLQGPAGTAAIPGLNVGSVVDRGIWAPDATHIQIQSKNDTSNYINIGGGYIAFGPAQRTRLGYADDVTANSLQLYYAGVGFSSVGSGEAYGAAGAAKIFSWLTAGFQIESGKTFRLGNAAITGLTAGVLAALTNASVTITDSAGQLYRIPCII